ncbi:MAG TPA: hypothetical protein VJW20_24195 [Candidatus Angelobacter sp.]|nr:hypothetical protein [Candidatus Angelobacter sp.]
MAQAARVQLLLVILIVITPVIAPAQTRITQDVSAQPGSVAKDAVPRMVKFSGTLVDGAGRPISGTVPAMFSIYAQQQDEQPLWMESQIVTADASGEFTVLLGASTTEGLPLDQFQANHAQWLGFHAEGQLEQPRVLLVSAPYALKAADAESLNGLPATAFVQWKDLQSPLATEQASSATPAKSLSTTPITPTTTTTTTDPTNFIPKYVDATTFVQSALFDAGGKVGINTQTPVAVLHITGDGTAELAQLEATADANSGLAILNTTQSWELALRQDLQEALVVRNKTAGADVMQISAAGNVSVSGKLGVGTTTPQAQLDVAGDVKLSATGGGIIFPDGSKQTTASQTNIAVAPNTVVERDDTGSISAQNANLQGNLQIPVNGYIATSDVVDANVGAIPKLFLSASGGPNGGVIPSLTFRSLNPNNIYGEIAFQDNTPSPGQDIWALAQDLFFTRTENLGFRRRGQSVFTFLPLSPIGSDVLTVFSGSRVRLERSGPYPFEFRDDSLALPKGLWRTTIAQDCWLLDKNTAVAGDFSTHVPVIQTCADLNLVLAGGMILNGPISASTNFSVTTPGNVSFGSTGTGSIRFTTGHGGYTYFGEPVGIGTTPQGSLHLLSGGNFQDGIFASFLNANEGISIRNTVQDWAMGVRADRNQEFDIRNITAGFDAVEISNLGDVSVDHGQLNPTQGISVGKGVDADGSGLKHGRKAIGAVAKGAVLAVELDWKTPFADTNYTVNCSVVNGAADGTALRLHHIQSVLANKVIAVVENDDPTNSQSGVLNCMAMHD